METTINWFDYSENSSDITIVMTFLKDLPGNLKALVDSKNSTFKEFLNTFDNHGINSSLFEKAFSDATDEFEINFIMEDRSLKLDEILQNNIRKERFARDLQRNGLTRESLRLKVNTLKLLWNNVMVGANTVAQGIIDFANKQVVKLLQKFFTYLNSFLGSISKVFTGLEAIKEIKEIIEAYLNIAED